MDCKLVEQEITVSGTWWQVSDWSEVLSSVPQGSVLGPILFVLYINDINDSLNSKILKFADDTKLWYSQFCSRH